MLYAIHAYEVGFPDSQASHKKHVISVLDEYVPTGDTGSCHFRLCFPVSRQSYLTGDVTGSTQIIFMVMPIMVTHLSPFCAREFEPDPHAIRQWGKQLLETVHFINTVDMVLSSAVPIGIHRCCFIDHRLRTSPIGISSQKTS